MYSVVEKIRLESGADRGQEIESILDAYLAFVSNEKDTVCIYVFIYSFSPTHYNLKVAIKTYSPKMLPEETVWNLGNIFERVYFSKVIIHYPVSLQNNYFFTGAF